MELYAPDAATVQYDLHFRAPFFELGSVANELLQTIYRAVSPYWVPNLEDMRINSGPLVADTALSVSLFRGNAVISVRPSGLRALFTNVTKDDGPLVNMVTSAALQSVMSCVPVGIAGDEWFRLDLQLLLDSGKQGRDRVLNSAKERFSAPEMYGWTATPIFKMQFDQPSKHLMCTGEVGPKWANDGALFCTFFVVDADPQKFMTTKVSELTDYYRMHIERLGESMTNLFSTVLTSLDLVSKYDSAAKK